MNSQMIDKIFRSMLSSTGFLVNYGIPITWFFFAYHSCLPILYSNSLIICNTSVMTVLQIVSSVLHYFYSVNAQVIVNVWLRITLHLPVGLLSCALPK